MYSGARHLRFVIGVVVAGVMGTRVGDARAAPEQARAADEFVDTIGVNIHLHFTGGVYDAGFDTIIKPRLAALGIRHVRDGAYTYPEANADTFFYQRVRELAALGIRFDLLTSMNTGFGVTTDFSKLADVYAWCDGAVASFEGVNEPNLQGKDDWIEQTKFVQKSLYETIKGTPALADVRVLGPSPVLGGGPKLGDVSEWLDYGNAHPYPGGECPSCGDVYAQNLETYMPEFTAPSGDAMLAMTETGYHNAINSTENHRPASELAAGKYMPRLFLEYFNRGFVRTFSYEFIDQHDDPERTNPEANFGLLRFDGSEKPAYVAMQSLIGLLGDPGPAYDPQTLEYELGGELERVHSTLLQKRDGRFFLALWLERSSYDTGARQNVPDDLALRGDLDVAPQAVTITLDQAFATARLHQFMDEGSIAMEIVPEPAVLEVTITDRLLVVELVPEEAPSGTDSSSETGATGETGATDATGASDPTGATGTTDPTGGTGGSDSLTGDPGTTPTSSAGETQGEAGSASSSGGDGTGDADGDAGGCACRAQRTNTPGAAAWLLVLGLLRRRRRA